MLAVLVYALLRIHAGFNYFHPDEIIPLQVISRIFETGSWDTNWKIAALPEIFTVNDQYNFSSYIVFSSLLLKVILPACNLFGLEPNTGDILNILRTFSSLWQVAIIFLTYAVGCTLFRSRSAGMIAAWSVVLFPSLFQDSLYARPESFTTMLALAFLLIANKSANMPSYINFSTAGFTLGWLVACKITFSVLLFIPVLAVFYSKQHYMKNNFRLFIALGAGIAIGFTAGAPFAVLNPGMYFNGLRSLFFQYSGSHPPYGAFSGTLTDRILYAWNYLKATGILTPFLVAIAALFVFAKEHRYFLIWSCLPFFFILCYFSVNPVFFERNFSVSLPVIALCFGTSVAKVATIWDKRCESIKLLFISIFITALALNTSVLFVWRMHSMVLSGEHEKQRALIRHEFVSRFRVHVKNFDMPWEVHDKAFQEFSKFIASEPLAVYEIIGANDEYTRNFLAKISRQLRMEVVTKLPSPFSATDLPPSTLYTYHATEYFYIANEANRFREATFHP